MKSIWFVLTLALFVSCTVNKQKSLEIDTTVIGDSLDNGHALMVKSNKYINNNLNIFVRDSCLREVIYESIMDNLQKGRIRNRKYYPESIVLGHLEEDTIVGNFDGLGIDTLYIDSKECGCQDTPFCIHAEKEGTIKYYLVSKSGRIPNIQLFAADCLPPRIVNEGDLDGDGKTEIGYMYTWLTSQWRCYRILAFHKNEWRYLINPNEEYMSTSRAFRLSGYEIAEPGTEKGTVLIHYLPEGLNQIVRDTIVKPTYIRIEDN